MKSGWLPLSSPKSATIRSGKSAKRMKIPHASPNAISKKGERAEKGSEERRLLDECIRLHLLLKVCPFTSKARNGERPPSPAGVRSLSPSGIDRRTMTYIHGDDDEFVTPYLGQQTVVSDPVAP
jgi:hypothetical protein